MSARYNRKDLLAKLNAAVDATRLFLSVRSKAASRHRVAQDKRKAIRACEAFVTSLDDCSGRTLQERWAEFESTVWQKWMAGKDRAGQPYHWAWGPRMIVMSRLVVPSWEWIKDVHLMNWIVTLPETDPLFRQYDRLVRALEKVSWASGGIRHQAARSGLRLMLARGYRDLSEITDADLEHLPSEGRGTDVLDAALCSLGVFDRTPQRGSSRKKRRGQKSVQELVAIADIPERFRDVTVLYLATYETRISDVYVTRRHKGDCARTLLAFYCSTLPRGSRLGGNITNPSAFVHSRCDRTGSGGPPGTSVRRRHSDHRSFMVGRYTNLLFRYLHLGDRT
jgi:hypothetical protein